MCEYVTGYEHGGREGAHCGGVVAALALQQQHYQFG